MDGITFEDSESIKKSSPKNGKYQIDGREIY